MPKIHTSPFIRLVILLCILQVAGINTGIAQVDSAQAFTQSKVNKSRFWLVTGGNIALWTGSFLALNQTWYSEYPRSSFHFFNDNDEWNQMDKMGHIWTCYHVSRLSAEMWEWAGLSRNKSVVLGGLSGIAYQSIIEIQDGFSSEWGFSWGDMTANVVGAAAYAAQELGWNEQRIQIKMNYWPHDYKTDELRTRRDQLFGKSLQERLLKDYNSQVYWISANLHSFFPESRLPRWLNISFGYSSDGMYGGTENKWTDKEGVAHDRSDIPRLRHFYLSPDIDLTKIKTKSKVLRSVFFVLNMIKIPAPSISISGNGKVEGYFFR